MQTIFRQQSAEAEAISGLGGAMHARGPELNDKQELEALTNAIKEVYYQDYKIAYNVSGMIKDDGFLFLILIYAD